jgi:hypothetical protein
VNIVVEHSDEDAFMAIPGGDGMTAGQIGRSPLWPVCQKTVRGIGGARGRGRLEAAATAHGGEGGSEGKGCRGGRTCGRRQGFCG